MNTPSDINIRSNQSDYAALLKRSLIELRKLKSQIETIERTRSEPIAIVGIGCRFPGRVADPESFWRLLERGEDAITEVPRERWNIDDFYDPNPDAAGKICTRFGGFIEDVDAFDADFFGISPIEAIGLDPQQRLLLEVSWEALERAGLDPGGLSGTATGVFIGVCGNDYYRLLASRVPEDIDAYMASGSVHSVAAGRVSYLLGLTGPSLAVDTACSSSLVAIHLACQSLRNGDCDLALAGGVSCHLAPEMSITFSRARMLAPDGHCKTFDASADGYVRSEGCGVMVLKRLSNAVALRDRILAIVRGSAVNQDGRTSGLTVPNGPAQEEVIRKALRNASVDPSQISYVETHGTGTSLGDPIELRALGSAFGRHHHNGPLWIGSVKTNIGHLEGAAGVAGAIKTVLSLGHRQIPAHLHFRQANPHVAWDELPLRVPTETTPWAVAGVRMAGVSSFGFSGTNAHIILEEWLNDGERTVNAAPQRGRPLHLFTLSAKSEAALRELASRYAQSLERDPEVSIADVCFTAATGRGHFDFRLAAIVESIQQLRQRMVAYAQASTPSLLILGRVDDDLSAAVTFDRGVHVVRDGNTVTIGIGARANWPRLLEELAALYVRGAKVNWREFYDGCPGRNIELPTYAFQRQRFWIGSSSSTSSSQSALANVCHPPGPSTPHLHPLLGNRTHCAGAQDKTVFEIVLKRPLPARQQEHRVFGTVVLPSSFYIEAALVGAAHIFRTDNVVIRDLGIQQPLVFPNNESRIVQLLLHEGDDTSRRCQSFSRGMDEGDSPSWSLHASAVVAKASPARANSLCDPSLVDPHGLRPVSVPAFYNVLRQRGIEYGPSFRAIRRLWAGGGDALGEIHVPDSIRREVGDFWLHPAWLDGCLQVVAAALPDELDDKTYLQFGLASLEVFRRPIARGDEADHLTVYSRAGLWSPVPAADGSFTADVTLLDPSGVPIARITGLSLRGIGRDGIASFTEPTHLDWLYEIHWQPRTDAARLEPVVPLVTPHRICDAVAAYAEASADSPDLHTYDGILPDIESVSAGYAGEAFEQLGCGFYPEESFTTLGLARRLNIADTHHRLLERLLSMLEESGGLRRAGSQWVVTDSPARPEAAIEMRKLLTRYPAARNELLMLERCGTRLAEVLTGQCDPLTLLFPADHSVGAANIYHDAPGARLMNELLGQAVKTALSRLNARRKLRILEIGAGAGSATVKILPVLPRGRTEYFFTDLSPLFLAQARGKLDAESGLRYARLDIECEPADQGFDEHSFDLIVAANVLHATRDLTQTIRHVRKLLKPGAELVLLESTEPRRWVDLIFGLSDGWWRFADDGWRCSHPLISIRHWQRLLGQNGFREAAAVSPPQEAVALLSQQAMIVAQASRRSGDQRQQLSGHWLVFSDGGGTGRDAPGVGPKLACMIRDAGASCTEMLPGPEYRVLSPERIEIDRVSPEDYRRLLQDANRLSRLTGVVHLWALYAEKPESLTTDRLEQDTKTICGSALHLVQSLASARLAVPPRLWLITRGAQQVRPSDRLSVAQAPLVGLSKVIDREHPELACKLIDLDFSADADSAHLIFRQCCQPASATEQNLAFRDKRWHVPRLVRSRTFPPRKLQLREDATYLVTGGLGGIGLLVGRHLVERGARHLILLARRGPEAGRAGQLKDLKKHGTTIAVTQADVSRVDQLTPALTEALRLMPPLRGVFHTAGIFDDRLLVEHRWDLFADVFAAKVIGSWNLHLLTREMPIDFFVLFSSVASWFGNSGLGNYVAANAFVDALACYRRACRLPALSVNWGLWEKTGMAEAARERSEALWSASGIEYMRSEQALQVLEFLLPQDIAQCGVVRMNWGKFMAQLETREQLTFFQQFVTRPDPATSGEAFLPKLERAPARERAALLAEHVRSVVCEVLALPLAKPINTRKGFFDLGMDSLTSVALRNRLQANLNCTLSPTVAFQYSSIDTLVDHLARDVLALDFARNGEHPASNVLAERAPPVSRFEQLSAAEAGALLDQKLADLERLF